MTTPSQTCGTGLLFLLVQILEDELTPSAAACVHQRATLVELSQLDGCEPELFGQIRHGRDPVLVIARQKDDPMAALYDRVGSQNGCTQVIETFHEPSAGERLRDEGGGQGAAQFFRGNSKRVRRVDDRLAFPSRQDLRHLAVFPKRDRQDDCVGLECIPKRLGDDRGSNRPSLRRQSLRRPATRDSHHDVFTGERVGEGLTYLSESYDCVAHSSPLIHVDIDPTDRIRVSALAIPHSPRSADFRWPRSRRRHSTPPRSRSLNRRKQETARPSRFPQVDPSFPAGSGFRTSPSLPWGELVPASVWRSAPGPARSPGYSCPSVRLATCVRRSARLPCSPHTRRNQENPSPKQLIRS